MLTKREQIIAIAIKMFRKRGYVATTMRDIAREVGMEPASLYNHIKSKQDILESSLLEIADMYTLSMKNVTGMDKTAYEKLEQLIGDQINITIQNIDAVSLVPSEWIHLEVSKSKFIESRNDYEAQFKFLLQEAVNKGHLRELDIELTTFSILSTLRYLFSWYSRNKDKNLDDLHQALTKNLLEGIKK